METHPHTPDPSRGIPTSGAEADGSPSGPSGPTGLSGVEIVERQPQPAAVLRRHIGLEEIPDFLSEAFGTSMRVIGAQRLGPAGPPFACYVRENTGFLASAGFPTRGEIRPDGGVEPEVLPGGPTATLLYRGEYAGIAAAYTLVEQWVAEHGYTPSGPPWESYLDDPDVDRPRTLLQLPCTPTAAS